MPTPNASIDVDAHLAGLEDDFRAYDLGSYHHYQTRKIRPRMNWKLVIDTFLESYHIQILHSRTVAPMFHSNIATFDPFGMNARIVFARKSIAELRGRPEEDLAIRSHTVAINVIVPNCVIVIFSDHVEIWRAYPSPNSVDECIAYISFYTPEPATTEEAKRHWDANVDLLMRTVQEEDFPVGEGIQRGCLAGTQDHLTYGWNEPGLAHYHRSLRRALRLDDLKREE